MSIKVNGQDCKVYKGDHKPVNLYRGDKKIAGWHEETQVGEGPLVFENTYDDEASVVIEGNTEQIRTEQGLNLLDIRKASFIEVGGESYPGTLTIEGDVISYEYLPGSYGIMLAGAINVNPNTEYSASCLVTQIAGTLGPSYGIRVHYLQTGIYSSVSQKWNITFNTGENTSIEILFYVGMASPTGGIIEFINFQYKLGLLVPFNPFVPDSPSPDYPSEVNSVEEAQLINHSINIWDDNSWSYIGMEDELDVLIFNGYYTAESGSINGNPLLLLEDTDIIKGNVYTVSGKFKKGIYWNKLLLRFKDNTRVVLGEFDDLFEESSLTFAIPIDKEPQYLYIETGAAYVDGYVEKGTLQVEVNATKTSWFEYIEPTEIVLPILRKIKEVADTYNPTTGEYIQRIGKKEFDGAESWVETATANQISTIRCSVAMAVKGTVLDYYYNTHFQHVITSTLDMECSYTGLNYIALRIKKNKLVSQDALGFKVWLVEQYAKGTPVTVYYQLAEPITAYLDPVTVPTFPGTTVIEQDGEVKGMITATTKVMD
jgi:hypothetical protein